MEKIQFVNNSEPYLSAENLNQMQDNIENAINEKNYLVATITNEQSLSSNYILSLNSVVEKYGDKLTLSNGKIVVGAGVNKIRVSGSIFVNSPSGTGYVWGVIRKGFNHIGSNITYASSGTSFMSSSIPTNIVSVQEGDTIDLMADSTCGGTARTGRSNTWLYVEVIG